MTMKKTIKKTFYIFLSALGLSATAKENVSYNGLETPSNPSTTLAYNCAPGTSQTLLDINNVKTTILNGGDMWWNLSDGKYEIPKGSGKHSLFAGALWIGGYDESGNLKVAAQTYRQTGNDFWPGPLDNARLDASENNNSNYGTTDASICAEYDKHYVILRSDVEEFVAYMQSDDPSGEYPDYTIPQSILNYPANRITDDLSDAYQGADEVVGSNPYYALETLAPYRDVNNDGQYDPFAGDYPEYNIDGALNCKDDEMLFGDQTLWWVYNDNGNAHTESGSTTSIGLEIQAQAFSFATNDEINNMTFYNYKLINRSHKTLNDTYFGVWVDPDLGEYNDDYVGCDVARGLGYCYNGDEEDEGAAGYGANPPAIGVDFFRGPLADPVYDNNDSLLNQGEQLMMTKFMYYDNDFTDHGNPSTAEHFYNYLLGKWKDGQPMTYGDQGYTAANPLCNYMFPGDTDPAFEGNPWTEQIAGNDAADRRFVQSAGAFTLEPGAVNTITTGVVWARASEGGAWASVEKMRIADDKAQTLFDVCFEVLNGPDAPDLSIQELSNELIITLSNPASSNNFLEAYNEADPVNIIGSYDEEGNEPYRDAYIFEGYQVFQLADETVTATDIYDIDKARLVFQCDKENYRNTISQWEITTEPYGEYVTDGGAVVHVDFPAISDLVNYEYNQDLGANEPKDMTLSAANEGISHSFSFTQDLFAKGDRALVNNKTYYFTVVAYAYNEYISYKQDQAPDVSNPYAPSYLGQKTPYLPGRKRIKQYSAIPHIPAAEQEGTIQNSEYGTLPEITRIEGTGNGGLELNFTEETKSKIISEYCADEVTYALNGGPVMVKVVDPLSVPDNHQFSLLFDGVDEMATWVLVNETTGDSIFSETTITIKNEQIISDWGISVTVLDAVNPGDAGNGTNGLLSVNLNKESTTTWLNYVRDEDILLKQDEKEYFVAPTNWIRAGIEETDNGLDDDEAFETILNGAWTPYKMAGATTSDATIVNDFNHTPVWNSTVLGLNKFNNLASVDIVFTSDTSLWTRVPVLETGNTVVDDRRLDIKSNPSVDKEGNPDNSGTTGFSWFPGYALDLESGTRLNMMFGEASELDTANAAYDSLIGHHNGDDMIWNPTSTVEYGNAIQSYFYEQNTGEELPYYAIFGGRHYVYVMSSAYAGDDAMENPHYTDFQSITNATKKRNVMKYITWVSIPLLTENETLLDGDVEINIRVSKSYENYANEGTNCEPVELKNDGNPYYTFNTDEIGVILEDKTTAENALDLIKIVPNPYYGTSNYEKGQIDNTVKITNLPKICTVSIYNVSGTLVRRVHLDSEENVKGWDWDLKNNDNVSIASGVYIIHVDAGEFGETVLKWFGTLRPIDLDSF